MTGKDIRLGKLFCHGRPVVVAIDHGEFDGPIPHLENLPAAAARINPDVDGILLSPGMIERCTDVFAKKGAPLPIVRLNWSTTYCFQWGLKDAETVEAVSASQAAVLGAEAVCISLALNTGNEARDARNVEVFCRLAAEAKRIGLPIIGEYFPAAHESLSPDELHREVKIGCRVIAELGSDAVKTFYTKQFKEVTGGCPVPILGLGAERLPTQLDALSLARREMDDGAGGVVFGRNAISWPNPARFQAALIDVVRNGKTPRQAAKAHKLPTT